MTENRDFGREFEDMMSGFSGAPETPAPELEQPSEDKIDQELSARYTAVARQLETLADNCGNDTETLATLKNTPIELNWRDYPRQLQGEREALIAHIEQHITGCASFDDTLYVLHINGATLELDDNNQHVFGELIQNSAKGGYIGAVKLYRSFEDGYNPTDSDVEHYQLLIEFTVPSVARGGEDSVILLPVESILGIINTRDGRLFNTLTNQSVDVQTEPSADLVVATIEDSPEDTNQVVETIGTHEYITPRELELAALDQRFKILFKEVGELIGRLYDTREEASAAHDKVGELVLAFTAEYPKDRPILVELLGAGARHFSIQVDSQNSDITPDEDGAITLRLNGLDLKESDITSETKGHYAFNGYARFGESAAHDGKFAVGADLLFNDANSLGDIDFSSCNDDVMNLVGITVESQIVARLDSSTTSISIPEYERFLEFREIIKRIGEQLSDLIDLPGQLAYLHDFVVNADSNQFEELEDLSLIHNIGDTVGGDEGASQLAADALYQIFVKRSIAVTADMYDTKGVLVKSQIILGPVDNVISEYPAISINEPMFVMVASGETWYVPISNIMELQF